LGVGLIFSGFFFSCRRRHTRFSRDWSSDVCSSDLKNHAWVTVVVEAGDYGRVLDDMAAHGGATTVELRRALAAKAYARTAAYDENGRASCRETVTASEVREILIRSIYLEN